MQVKKQQLVPDMEQWTGSKLGMVYIKAVYCHSAYLTYMQGFLGGANGKEPISKWRRLKRCGFDPQVRKIP